MAGWDEVRRIALAMPEASERVARGLRQWRVREKLFVWERPLRPREIGALGAAAPTGPILGARVEHLAAKQVLLASEPRMFFTTPHFEGYPAVLVRLEKRGDEAGACRSWYASLPRPRGAARRDASEGSRRWMAIRRCW
jgi:hypothetical protein